MKGLRLLTVFATFLLVVIAPLTAQGAPLIVDLIVGGGNPDNAVDGGDFLIWNSSPGGTPDDSGNLYISVETADGWCATQTHIEIFQDPVNFTDVPLGRGGNPKVGKFDITMNHACATRYDVPPIPLNRWVAGTRLYIAAHAEVEKLIEPDIIRDESAWVLGDDFPGKSWAMFFEYIVQDYCNSMTGYADTSCVEDVVIY